MRKYFIDNLRFIAVLLLFPFHTSMIYNNFGEDFYVKGVGAAAPTIFIFAVHPWFMPLLFVLAGIGTRYALQRRTPGQYARERVVKLLVPFVAGILLLVPVQTYSAERFHNGYTGGYFAQYRLFFGKVTDFTGYAGGLTPGQLWFILYLFIISMAALPLITLYRKSRQLAPGRWPVLALAPLCLLTFLMTGVGDIGGKSLGEYFMLFGWGYLLLADADLQQKLQRSRWRLLAAALPPGVVFVLMPTLFGLSTGFVYDLLMRVYGWLAVLAILAFGRQHLDFSTPFTRYMAAAAFPVYMLHQSVLVAVAYYVFLLTNDIGLQFPLILCGSLLLTFLLYEVCRRIPFVRLLLGIKNPTQKDAA